MRNCLMLLVALILFVGLVFGQQESKKESNSDSSGSIVVTRVLSGDLLELKSGERLRLMGADAPVLPEGKKSGQEPWASEALKFTENMVLGKEITVKSFGIKSDEYGRLTGVVYIGETCLDCELVKYGMAVVQFNRYLGNSTKQILVEAQREARAGYRGIWNSTNPLPQPPREFRIANNFPEGDDKNADSWKNVKTKTPRTNGTTSSKSSDPAYPSTGGDTASTTVKNISLQAAAETLDALKEIENKVDAGIKSGVLAKLLIKAREKFAEVPTNGIDRNLVRDLKDALDAYQLALEAFKKRENATDADRDKYNKYIEKALEIAETSVNGASKRLEQLENSK